MSMTLVKAEDARLGLSWSHTQAGLAALRKLALNKRADMHSHTYCIRATFLALHNRTLYLCHLVITMEDFASIVSALSAIKYVAECN